MSNYVTVVPAYGRDYKSGRAALADWNAGRDFIIRDISHHFDGALISKPEMERDLNTTHVKIRYNNLRSVVVEKIKHDAPTPESKGKVDHGYTAT